MKIGDYEFINLTGKRIVVGHVDGDHFKADHVFDPSGETAKAIEIVRNVDRLEGVDIDLAQNYRSAKGLPPPRQNVILIVNYYIRSNFPHRSDLMSPGYPVKDQNGWIIGVNGLYCNNQNKKRKQKF